MRSHRPKVARAAVHSSTDRSVYPSGAFARSLFAPLHISRSSWIIVTMLHRWCTGEGADAGRPHFRRLEGEARSGLSAGISSAIIFGFCPMQVPALSPENTRLQVPPYAYCSAWPVQRVPRLVAASTAASNVHVDRPSIPTDPTDARGRCAACGRARQVATFPCQRRCQALERDLRRCLRSLSATGAQLQQLGS